MNRFLYLSLTPEALIASMIPPEEFGCYMAVGTKKKTRGLEIFFEIDSDFRSEHFPFGVLDERCVPHEDGTPKHSVYLSVYRVLEYIPLNALKELYLATDDGMVLRLEQGNYSEEGKEELHLYQELCPVTPRVTTRLNPREFVDFVTDITQPVSVPRIAFVELILNGLARDPLSEDIGNLPYPNIEHLRDCLSSVTAGPCKHTKTVIRTLKGHLLYRTCKNGFFVGDPSGLLFYPFPSAQELEGQHYVWWRSAQTVSM